MRVVGGFKLWFGATVVSVGSEPKLRLSFWIWFGAVFTFRFTILPLEDSIENLTILERHIFLNNFWSVMHIILSSIIQVLEFLFLFTKWFFYFFLFFATSVHNHLVK